MVDDVGMEIELNDNEWTSSVYHDTELLSLMINEFTADGVYSNGEVMEDQLMSFDVNLIVDIYTFNMYNTVNGSKHVLRGCLHYNRHYQPVIADRTKSHSVLCKFSDDGLLDEGTMVLLINWKYIVHEKQSYIEVNDYQIIPQLSLVYHSLPSPENIIKLSQLTHHPKPHKGLIIEGTVTSVSVILNKLRLIQLQDGGVKWTLVAMNSVLLKQSQFLKIFNRYVFTCVSEKALSIGEDTYGHVRVFTDSSSTGVYPCTTHESPAGDKGVTCPSGNVLCYQGMVTDVAHYEAGLYQLDNSIHVLLYKGMDSLGMRVGAIIRLYLVHLVNSPFFKGFYCCPISTLTIVSFSSIDSLYEPVLPQKNKLLPLIHSNQPGNTLWLVYAYIKLKQIIKCIHQVLMVVKHLKTKLNDENYDPFLSFISDPHDCGSFKLTMSCTISSIEEMISSSDYPSINENNTSGSYSLNERNVESRHCEVLLVGHVTGSDITGHMTLVDSTGSVHLASQSLITDYNHLLVIDSYKVVSERVRITHPSLCYHDYTLRYIIPISWSSLSCDESPPIPEDVSHYYFIIRTKSHLEEPTDKSPTDFEAYLYMTDDINQLDTNTFQPSSSAGSCYSFKISRKCYTFLRYGNIYRLSTSLPLESVGYIDESDVIVLIEEQKYPLKQQRLCHILNDIYLWRDKVVTFSGQVTKTSYRINNSPNKLCSNYKTLVDISDVLYDSMINHELVLAIEVQDGIDSIVVYVKLNQIFHPLGILPNSWVRFEHVVLMISKSGNPYFTNIPSSDITLLSSGDATCTIANTTISTTTTTLLHTMIEECCMTRCGYITCHNVREVSVNIMNVQRVDMEYICVNCKSPVAVHIKSCRLLAPVFSASAVLLVSDGSGEAHLYCDDQNVKQLLNINEAQWEHLMSLTSRQGRLKYVRYSSQFKEMNEDNKYNEISAIISSSDISKHFKALVRPFISKSQIKCHKDGCRVIYKKLRGGGEYTIFVHPKLQLRLLSIQQSSYRNECRKMLMTHETEK